MSKQANTQRSNILVHWTGAKDIEKAYNDAKSTDYKNDDIRCIKYVERLDTTLQEGLWMNGVDIEMYDSRDACVKCIYPWPATCFTEVRLSETQNHAEQYGFLGFGFTRDFVMKRYGGPVLYLAETDYDMLSPHFIKLFYVLQFLKLKTVLQDKQDPTKIAPAPNIVNFVHAFDLDGLLKHGGYIKDPKEYFTIFEKLWASIISIAIFTKKMSEYTVSPQDFICLNEAEWRIPRTTPLPDVDPPIKIVADKDKVDLGGGKKGPVAKIPFRGDDLKILILPNAPKDEIRKQALGHNGIRDWLFKDPAHIPTIATVEECLQF